MTKIWISLIATLMLSTGAWAADFRSGGTVVIGPDQPVAQDLLAAGSDVTVSASVTGDVTAAGRNVSVLGPVSGSIFAAGGSVAVTGRSGNDVRLAGGEVSLAAPVADTAYLAGGKVMIATTATVGSDLLAAGNQIDVLGSVGKNARLAGADVTIGGTVNGDVYAKAARVKLLSTAVIKGNLFYESPNAAQIAPGARIGGQTVHTLPPQEKRRPVFWSLLAWWLLGLAMAFLFGVVLLWLFPARTLAAADTARAVPGASIGIGFLALIVTPVLAFIAMVTVVGLPLGLALLAIYLILLYAAKVFVGLAVGRWILSRSGMSGGSGSSVVALIVGLVVLAILSAIPILGWLVRFVVLLLGLGAFLISWWRERETREPAPEAQATGDERTQ